MGDDSKGLSSETSSQTQLSYHLYTEENKEDLAHEHCHRRLADKIWREKQDHLKRFINPRSLFQYLVNKDLLTHDQQIEFHESGFVRQRDIVLQAVPSSNHDDYLERFIGCLKESSEEAGAGHTELAESLSSSLGCHLTQFVCSLEETTRTIVASENGNAVKEVTSTAKSHYIGINAKMQLESPKRPDGFFKKHCSKGWLICYSVVIIPSVIGILILIALSQSPSVALSNISPQQVAGTAAAMVDFGINPIWISSLSLERISSCITSVIVITGAGCDQLPITSEVGNISTSLPFFLYLLPGSVLNVTISETADDDSELWIIKSIETFLLFKDNGDSSSPFPSFQCERQRQDAQCYKVADFRGQDLPSYVVSTADYYFMVGRPLPLGFFSYSFLNNSYDPLAISERYTLRNNLVRTSTGSIQVSSFLDFRPKCVLLLTNCGQTPVSVGYVTAERRQDVLIIPGIVVSFVCLLYVGLVLLVHFLRKIKK